MAGRDARAVAKSWAVCTGCGSITNGLPCRDRRRPWLRLQNGPTTRRRSSVTTLQERGEVSVNGKRLETLWISPQQTGRATIVMLHEGLGSIALWKDFPQRLASCTGCGVLVYSRYGHGNSDKLMEKRPVEFMHHEGEVVLPALLDKLGIRQPILLGHSDGASISIIF